MVRHDSQSYVAPAAEPAVPDEPEDEVELPAVVNHEEDYGDYAPEPEQPEPVVHEEVEDEKPVYVPDYDGRLQIATYNMALDRVNDPTAEERLEAAAIAAVQMPGDVVCL